MRRSIRVVGIGISVMLGVLAVAAGYHQAVAGDRYRNDLRNPRAIAAVEDRGRILTTDGRVAAVSVDDDGRVGRRYPAAERYAHPVGHATLLFGDTAIEARRADDLRSPPPDSLASLIRRLLGDDLTPHDIVITIDDTVQQTAAAGLGDQRGAVVALDAATGEIVAWVSTPAYDPNRLTGPAAGPAGEELASRTDLPLVDRVRQAVYPPGSTFKVLVAAAALDAGLSPDSPLDDLAEYRAPGTERPITNFRDGPCEDGSTITLSDALVVSCNTAFAALGVELGGERISTASQDAGFGERVPFELATEIGFVPDADALDADLPALAQSSIGGRDVRVTPLQMALVAAAVANGGEAPRPVIVDRVIDRDEIVDETQPIFWRRMFTAPTAAALREMMIAVVERGTGSTARTDGVVIGGKTGTAEVPDAAPHTWFIAFAEHGERRLALAVLVENGGALGDEGTGGRVAAPIARSVIEAWMRSGS
ncbi:MAG TPA: penicillin-binding transpeptidase domain-containing protein [Acidimicrobiia bacterium]|nr:penicillin-binding transpeptidase domain-containing protein [Acidimicrobiia bacterium]